MNRAQDLSDAVEYDSRATPGSGSAHSSCEGVVLETRLLTEGLSTTALGLGCAEIFSLPSRRSREALLGEAYDLGIRHYDVAPMYGLGAAEEELGRFVRGRRSQVTVATKFGIAPSGVSRAVRLVQPPLRAVLQRVPTLRAGLRSSAPGPSSGIVGSVLYRRTGYSREAARTHLENSLRVLRLDHLDVFLLHEPAAADVGDLEDLADYLESERAAGRIAAWGPAGSLGGLPTPDGALLRCQVVQRPDDLLTGRTGRTLPDHAEITFGVLSRIVPMVRQRAARDPGFAALLRSRWGLDVEGPDLGGLLLRDALRRNHTGVVLYATTKVDHLRSAVEHVRSSPIRDEAEVLRYLRGALGAGAAGRAAS